MAAQFEAHTADRRQNRSRGSARPTAGATHQRGMQATVPGSPSWRSKKPQREPSLCCYHGVSSSKLVLEGIRVRARRLSRNPIARGAWILSETQRILAKDLQQQSDRDD